MANRIVLIILSVVCLAGSAYSEVYNCNGVWKDSPCSGNEAEKVQAVREKAAAAKETETADLEKKKLVVHDLRMAAIEAKRSSGVESYEVENTADFCLKDNTALSSCERRVELVEKSLQVQKRREGAYQELERRSANRQAIATKRQR